MSGSTARQQQRRRCKGNAVATCLLAGAAIVSFSELAAAVPNFEPPPDVAATLPADWRRGLVSTDPRAPSLPWEAQDSPNLFRRKKDTGHTPLEACLVNAGIETTTTHINGTSSYWDAAQSDNLRFHYHPHAIAYPRTTEQVSTVMKCAQDRGEEVAVSARSGGHSFAGYGSGGQDGSLVVDLRYLDYVRANPGAQGSSTADVGPGSRLGDVVKGLWQAGKRGKPHGTCPPVGVGGHALCGGFGPTSRKWGMSTDAIEEVEMVLANGTVVVANAQENPELLWGAKGAGYNFGIVTRFKFRTFDVSGMFTFLEYRWTPSIKSAADAAKIVHAIQDFATSNGGKDLPEEMGFHVQLKRAAPDDPAGGDFAVHMRGMYMGPNATYQQSVTPKLWARFHAAGTPRPDRTTEQEMSYLEIMEKWDDFGKPGHKLDTVVERLMRNNFVARTQLTMSQKGFQEVTMAKTFEDLYAAAKEWRGKGDFTWNVYMEMYGGGSSARHRHADITQRSSFPHRDALWLIQTSVGTWGRRDISPEGWQALDDFDGAFKSAMAADGLERRSFPCYVDAHLTEGDEWKHLYFGDHADESAGAGSGRGGNLARLEALKIEVDPTNRFRNPQSLGGPHFKPQGSVGYAAVPASELESSPAGHRKISHPLPRGHVEGSIVAREQR